MTVSKERKKEVKVTHILTKYATRHEFDYNEFNNLKKMWRYAKSEKCSNFEILRRE